MASVRCRNGRYYFRVTVYDKTTKSKKWIERGGYATYEDAKAAGELMYPKRISRCSTFLNTNHLTDLVFKRFSINHPAHIPLKVLYYTGCSVSECYKMRISDLYFDDEIWKSGEKIYKLCKELKNLLKIQLKKIADARLIFLYPDKPDYVNVYLNSGKPIQENQIYYVQRVIRREINPDWNIKGFTYAQTL